MKIPSQDIEKPAATAVSLVRGLHNPALGLLQGAIDGRLEFTPVGAGPAKTTSTGSLIYMYRLRHGGTPRGVNHACTEERDPRGRTAGVHEKLAWRGGLACMAIYHQ